MVQLLDYEACKRLEKEYGRNPLMELIHTCYLPIENRMSNCCFSCVELWLNTLTWMDYVVALDERERGGHLERLWNYVYGDLRREATHASRTFTDMELQEATSCLLLFLAVCLRGSDQPALFFRSDSLFSQAQSHYAQSADLVNAILDAYTDEVSCFIKDYLDSGIHACELLSGKGSEIKPFHLSQRKKAELKERATRVLSFMKGSVKGSEVAVMKRADYDRMIQAISLFIDQGKLVANLPPLETKLKVDELRYSFYLLWKNHWNPYVGRDQVVDFLKATFAQFNPATKETISKKFSKRPEGYDYIPEGAER